jgi:hypothetical protein
MKEGQVMISSPSNSQISSYVEGYAATTNVLLTSNSIDAIDRIIREELHPFWTFSWKLDGNIDAVMLIERVNEVRGFGPSSTSGIGPVSPYGVPASYTHASFNLFMGTVGEIRVDIGNDSNAFFIRVVDDDGPNQGFLYAHNKLSPDIILSFLYVEFPRNRATELLLSTLSS